MLFRLGFSQDYLQQVPTETFGFAVISSTTLRLLKITLVLYIQFSNRKRMNFHLRFLVNLTSNVFQYSSTVLSLAALHHSLARSQVSWPQDSSVRTELKTLQQRSRVMAASLTDSTAKLSP